jgi:hypothetical protein
MGFDPCNCTLKIWESIWTPTPTMRVHLGVWGFIPSHSLHSSHSREHVMRLLNLPLSSQPCNPLALVASPRLGLQHLVLVLFLANLMRKVRNMLSPMHFETTTRLRTIILHMKGNVLLLYGSSYVSGPIFTAPISLCIWTTSLLSGWWSTISLLIN